MRSASMTRIAAALDCTEQAAEALITALAIPRGLTGMQRASLAMAAALHRQGGLEIPLAAAIVRGRRRLCEAVLSTVDFRPSGVEGFEERDPFMFFAPHMGDAAALPAIDNYIDVMDGRRICWKRPRRDPYRLACELDRLSAELKRNDTPALQDEYLELLGSLKGPAPQDTEWLGTIRDGAFMPAPERFAEPSPMMRQGPGIELDPSWSANVYGTCLSVNVSLAARCFKRRMLGLAVIDPITSQLRSGPQGQPAEELE